MIARLNRPFFSFVFGMTGVGTALMGAALPAILHEWHLSDSRGGVLLLAAWGGSTSGALFVHKRTRLSAAIGLALSAAGLFALSFAAASPLLPLLYALYGLGLGITMTSISIMRASDIPAQDVDVALNRLNLLWAIGALLAPVIALHSLRLLSVSSIFRLLGLLLALVSLVGFLFAALERGSPVLREPDIPKARAALPWAPVRFCLFAATAVGLESAIGSWLTTYAERSTLGVLGAVSANSAFWGGLLLSRGLHSISSARPVHTRAARLGHIGAVGAAVLLLIVYPNRGVLALAGFLCGFGLGPLYPWVLSIALPRFRSTAVFVLAGVGASLTPWLTGVLSSATGSLRTGLFAPAATFLLLTLTAYRMRTELN